MNGRVVDVHAHAIVSEAEAVVVGQPGLEAHRALDARRNGAESLAVSGKMVAARIPQLMGVDRRLADMDAAGIDVQVVSPSPSQYHYWADRETAQLVTSSANRGIAALVDEEPSRLVGLGLVPLGQPMDAVAALDDAIGNCGLAGVEISSFAPGVELSDEALEPFWARAAELGAIVFLHPFGCSLDERLDRFYLSNTVGQPTENAVALSHIIFSGVLDRHPTLKLLAAHGGGYLPTYIGRSDHAWEARPEARRCADRPSSYLSRITFDSLVHGPGALRALVDAVGAESVVLGSDYPFDMGNEDPVAEVRAANLSEEITRSILSDNAFRLGLSPAEAGVVS
ncbi:amidohydrolase [Rhodococcoides fascians]|uniref:amidohydrolase family protein n=1 Tax=Rhodococcoides fascians TaxID=1828 RepID=UPI000B9C3B30|nr:amidohydrolase family protein [Rhodococcus fascians]OZE91837.1 amidohydrolase [Rhodococcus fascians]OZF22115.1 amidohydrolase [Rhodococcus fascians]OZF24304.1 amidohydrolase [Rhodococcus fascians]OZF71897.1 amidohydrolase [Rhodococcus fascians]OZF73222.1 amidohydrolase [Rhodococcus fascians]